MKNFILIKTPIFYLIFTLLFNNLLQAQITVTSNFEGGNGTATFNNAATNELDLQSQLKGGDTKNIVYYAKISGLNTSMPLTLKVDAFWPGPTIVYSYDNITWQKLWVSTNNEFIVPLTSSSVFVAHSYPYTYSNMITDVSNIASLGFVHVSDLATSEAGRAVKLVRITDNCVADSGKELIWIFGRMHAFENPGSIVVKGMLDYFTSNQPSAAQLRKDAIIYVVPMMDVDQAYNGGSGKDQSPVDFNRDWNSINTPSHWNAVNAAKRWMDSTAQLNNFSVFFDSHSPPPSGTNLFYYIYDLDHQIANDRFVAETVKYLGNYPVTEYIYNSLDHSISQDYVLANYDNPRHFNVTMETGFKLRTDGMDWTKALYLQNGEYNAHAISDFIHGHANNNDILVDNNDVVHVVKNGNWISDTTIPGYFGDDYIYAGTQAPASITFNATIDTAGTYQVFTRWVSSANFASNVHANFSHSGATNDYTLDMSLRGGNWVSLDTFHFGSGEQVSLTINNTNANQTIVADGLRISKVIKCATTAIPNIHQEPNSFNFNIFPNPTQNSTTISFVLSEKSMVELTIFNNLGQKLNTISNKQMNIGKQQIIWDGKDEAGVLVGDGVYYCQLRVGGRLGVGKLVVVR